jgi:hypothetical protein
MFGLIETMLICIFYCLEDADAALSDCDCIFYCLEEADILTDAAFSA